MFRGRGHGDRGVTHAAGRIAQPIHDGRHRATKFLRQAFHHGLAPIPRRAFNGGVGFKGGIGFRLFAEFLQRFGHAADLITASTAWNFQCGIALGQTAHGTGQVAQRIGDAPRRNQRHRNGDAKHRKRGKTDDGQHLIHRRIESRARQGDHHGASGIAAQIPERLHRQHMRAAPRQHKIKATDRLAIALRCKHRFGQGINGKPFNGGGHQAARAKQRCLTAHHLAKFRDHSGRQACCNLQCANNLAGLILHWQRRAGRELAG